MPYRHRIFPSLFAILLLGLVSACGNDGNVTLRLTPAERSRIDTLYRIQLDSLRPIWEQACETNYPKMVRAAVDSIVTERIAEEERLRARTLNPQPQ
jgi:hypothetical protein